MFDAYQPIDPREEFREEQRLMLESLEQVKNDTGAAYAYMYCGNDTEYKQCLSTLSVYVMMRPEPNETREFKRVDYFLPAIVADTETDALAAQGFVRVGYIDNHYNDVLGVAEGVIDETVDAYAENFAVACYSRLQSLTEEEAYMAEAEWATRKPAPILEGKREILIQLTKYKRGVETFYVDQLAIEPEKPEFN